MTNSNKDKRKLDRAWEELQTEKRAYLLRKQQEEEANRTLRYWEDALKEEDDTPL